MKANSETLTQPNLVETTTVDLRKSEALSETEEILNNPEAMESLKKAQEDLKAGKYDKWEDVCRRDLPIPTLAKGRARAV